MDVQTLLRRVGKNLTVGRAVGPSYESDGVLIVPVALVVGGGGAGAGPTNDSVDESTGAGYGGVVYPMGAYVARRGKVRFVPTVDVPLLAGFTLLLLRMVIKRLTPRR